ncbi:MAG TPA: hypothetical protein VEE83_01000 [Thermoplasmata archaeon]|nr:hypothetical protein [Thermoplasmata archaeon]
MTRRTQKRRATKRARPPPKRRRRASRAHPSHPARVPAGYVRLDIDLVHEAFQGSRLPFLRRLESIFREQEVVEVEGLLATVARVLHSLSSCGFSRVDHWEVHPGGWLALPEPAHERLAEPVGHLLNALKSEAWKHVATARSFSVRLSGPEDVRADLIVRRVHRERGHAVTLELFGRIPESFVRSVGTALRGQLSIVRVRRQTTPIAT